LSGAGRHCAELLPPARCEPRAHNTSQLPSRVSGVAVGDVLHLHDHLTGFSKKDRLRWCVVTAVFGRNVRVAGRSTTRTDGVPVSAEVRDEFTKDGWILRPAMRIALADALAARNIGPLPDHYLHQVLFFLNEEMP
jgi:hypothetical protein